MKKKVMAVSVFVLSTLISLSFVYATEVFDVNGDSKTGLHESVYALQVASGIIHKISSPYDLTGNGIDQISGGEYDFQLSFQIQGSTVFGDINIGKQGNPFEKYDLRNGNIIDDIISFRVIDVDNTTYLFNMIWKNNELKGGATKLVDNNDEVGATELIVVDLKQ